MLTPFRSRFELIVIAREKVIQIQLDHHYFKLKFLLKVSEFSALFFIMTLLATCLQRMLDQVLGGLKLGQDVAREFTCINLIFHASPLT